MEKTFEERVAEAKAAVPSITPQAAKQRKDKDSSIVFVDPRDAEDIPSTGLIPGALNVTLVELKEKPDAELPDELASRSRPVITACKGGPMGALAAHALKNRGFTDVSFIDGGILAWLDAGFPTEK